MAIVALAVVPAGWASAAAPAAASPRITADAGILMDFTTGVVLFEKNAHVMRHPASLTKIMTAIVVLETCGLQDVVTVVVEATRVSGSRIHIRPGQKFTVEDMLYSLLLESANDVAVALAFHVAGSEPAFAEMMNEKAWEIGARNTRFHNPHGLTERGHLTTAYDLALITRHALRYPLFAEAVRTRVAEIDRLDKEVVLSLHNTNKLLQHFEGADGVKTGTTSAAGRSLVASATRDDHKLVSVVLHSDSRWDDAARLLRYGFDRYVLLRPYRRGDLVQTVRVKGGMESRVTLVAGEDLAVVAPREYAGRLELSDLPGALEAPCLTTKPACRLIAYLDGRDLASVPLYPVRNVQPRTFWRMLRAYVLQPLSRLLSGAG
jgi:D-alanyl-D-alanine carboxypeptidase (penicillin-binding protein 5/6)